jgi:hypothetical protein
MKLSEKEKRAVKLGVLSTVAIILFHYGSDWFAHWEQIRIEGSVLKSKLETIDVGEAKQKGLLALVPTFEKPLEQEEQQFLFRDAFNEQLKKAGIKNEPLQIQANRRSPLTGYKSLHLVCKAKCKFSQALDLLAKLNENPYLVGVEEFKIKVDPKKRTEVELNLTVSTLTKISGKAS